MADASTSTSHLWSDTHQADGRQRQRGTAKPLSEALASQLKGNALERLYKTVLERECQTTVGVHQPPAIHGY